MIPKTSTGVKDIEQSSETLLFQNYPNPIIFSTNIPYSVPWRSHVSLTVYDNNGRVVEILVNKVNESGTYEISWTPKLPNGNYYYQLKCGDKEDTKKLIIAK